MPSFSFQSLVTALAIAMTILSAYVIYAPGASASRRKNAGRIHSVLLLLYFIGLIVLSRAAHA